MCQDALNLFNCNNSLASLVPESPRTSLKTFRAFAHPSLYFCCFRNHIFLTLSSKVNSQNRVESRLQSYVYHENDTMEDHLAKLIELTELPPYQINDSYLILKVLDSLRMSKCSEKYKEFIG